MQNRLLLCILVTVALDCGPPRLAANPETVSIEFVGRFDYPDPGYLFLGTGQINDEGKFVGALLSSANQVLGFTGEVSGRFSQPFSAPGDTDGFTVPVGVKNSGEICGCYDSLSRDHGFFRSGSSYKTYEAPGIFTTDTCVFGVNDSWSFVGYYQASGVNFAFAKIAERFITLPISGRDASARGINNLDEVVGEYTDDFGATYHGFFRASDGTITSPIDFPMATVTNPNAINDAGYIVGYWQTQFAPRGFVIRLPDTFVTYKVPGAVSTTFTGINNAGLIIGTCVDAEFKTHGFVAQLHTD